MILRVFGCIMRSNSGMLANQRYGGLVARTRLVGYECEVFVTRHAVPRICCQTDYCTHADKRRNYRFPIYSEYVPKSTSISSFPQYTQVYGNFDRVVRLFHNNQVSRKAEDECKGTPGECPSDRKKTLFQNFKQMYRDYWYVLVPVHVVTSLIWFGGFYYLVKSGVDVVALIEKLGLSERLADHLRDSKAGYLAMSFALYKLATPLRYMVTIGGTTISIKWLRDFGYIKPLNAKEIKEIYREQRKCMKEKKRRKREMEEKR